MVFPGVAGPLGGMGGSVYPGCGRIHWTAPKVMVRYHNGSIIRINILIIRISLLIIDKLGLQRSKKKHEVNVCPYAPWINMNS